MMWTLALSFTFSFPVTKLMQPTECAGTIRNLDLIQSAVKNSTHGNNSRKTQRHRAASDFGLLTHRLFITD